MKNPPSFQFYPQDFISDLNVQSMTDKEVGRYMKLLCFCWIEDGLIKGGSRVVDEWLNQSPIIRRCFHEKDGKLRNARLDKERQKQISWREKSSVGGRHSAEKKRLIKGGSRVVQPKGNQRSTLLSSSSTSVYAYVVEIIAYLNEKAGKKFSPKSSDTTRHITARLDEGRTVEDFKRVIDTKVAKWKGRTWPDNRTGETVHGDDFLRPSTLFRPTNFENYLNEVGAPRKLTPEEFKAQQDEELRRLRGKG